MERNQSEGGLNNVAAIPGIRIRARPAPWRRAWSTIRRKPLGMVSGVVIVTMVITAVFADVIAPYDPLKLLGPSLAPSSPRFLFGTDAIGRDLLSRIIYGARVSLWVGLIAVGFGTFFGALIGLVSGYFEGKLDMVLQRLMDMILSLPALILAMAIVSVLGSSTTNSVLAIAIVIVPGQSRVVRGAVLSVKQNQYVEAARALGASHLRILWFHVLVNVMAPIIVLASVTLGNAILVEASLSFLGLGTPPPTPSWGNMLSGSGRAYMEFKPMLAIYPGLAISLAVFSFNLLGDAVRDILDPRLRSI